MRRNARKSRQAVVEEHPFIVTAHWLKEVGHIGTVESTQTSMFFLEDFLEKFAMVVRSDGTLNGRSPFAEEVAVRLAKHGDPFTALVLFLRIADPSKRVLFMNPPGDRYPSTEIAGKQGKLGYLGLEAFAEVALKCGRKNIAKQLCLELVERVPAGCSPMTLIDTRIRALQLLEKIGVKTLSRGVTIAEEIEESEKFSY